VFSGNFSLLVIFAMNADLAFSFSGSLMYVLHSSVARRLHHP